MDKVNIINISWTKEVFPLSEIIENNKPIEDTGPGIYQVYGHHPVYGDESLVYIGRATNLAARLNNRFEFIHSAVRPTWCRLGKIMVMPKEKPFGWEESRLDDLINIVERILIKAHCPALNQQDNKGIFSVDEFNNEHFIIINWYDYGQLLPEVSTMRLSYLFTEDV